MKKPTLKKILIIIGVLILIPILLVAGLITFFLVRTNTNYKSDPIISPSGDYYLVNTVNKKDKHANNYSNVVLNVYSKNKELIASFNTNCGDFNSWDSGWNPKIDQVVMNCTDNGTTYIINPPFKQLEQGVYHFTLSASVKGTWNNLGGGELVISPDGTFQIKNLPKRFFDFTFPEDNSPIDGSGTWKIERVLLGDDRLVLDYDTYTGDVEHKGFGGGGFYVSSGKNPYLYTFLDEEYASERYELRKPSN
jgi:hypothetical protein